MIILSFYLWNVGVRGSWIVGILVVDFLSSIQHVLHHSFLVDLVDVVSKVLESLSLVWVVF